MGFTICPKQLRAMRYCETEGSPLILLKRIFWRVKLTPPEKTAYFWAEGEDKKNGREKHSHKSRKLYLGDL